MSENTTGGPAASEAESILLAGVAPKADEPTRAKEDVLEPSAADTGGDVTADAGLRNGTAGAGSTDGEGDSTPGAAQGPDLGNIPVPDEIREAGRLAPDHWLGMVDPTWSGEGEPPEWAIVGRWRSGEDGEIVEWQDNPDYQPSPRALDWPEPEDDVDRAVQLAATGYGPGEAVPRALLDHEVAVLTAPGGGPLAATTPDGTPVIPVFTSPVYLHTCGRLGYELRRVDESLLEEVPDGHLLYVNSSGPVSMTVEPAAVREVLDALQAPEPAVLPPAPEPVATTSSERPGLSVKGVRIVHVAGEPDGMGADLSDGAGLAGGADLPGGGASAGAGAAEGVRDAGGEEGAGGAGRTRSAGRTRGGKDA